METGKSFKFEKHKSKSKKVEIPPINPNEILLYRKYRYVIKDNKLCVYITSVKMEKTS